MQAKKRWITGHFAVAAMVLGVIVGGGGCGEPDMAATGAGNNGSHTSNTTATTSACDRFCEESCAWEQRCGQGTPDCLQTCLQHHDLGELALFYSIDFLAAVTECVNAASCDQSGDCFLGTIEELAPGYQQNDPVAKLCFEGTPTDPGRMMPDGGCHLLAVADPAVRQAFSDCAHVSKLERGQCMMARLPPDARSVLSGCASASGQSLDPTGTWNTSIAFGAGTCGGVGSFPYSLTVTKEGDGYVTWSADDITPTSGTETFTCSATECQLSSTATLIVGVPNGELTTIQTFSITLDATNRIVGTGSMSGTGPNGFVCSQALNVTGTRSMFVTR